MQVKWREIQHENEPQGKCIEAFIQGYGSTCSCTHTLSLGPCLTGTLISSGVRRPEGYLGEFGGGSWEQRPAEPFLRPDGGREGRGGEHGGHRVDPRYPGLHLLRIAAGDTQDLTYILIDTCTHTLTYTNIYTHTSTLSHTHKYTLTHTLTVCQQDAWRAQSVTAQP